MRTFSSKAPASRKRRQWAEFAALMLVAAVLLTALFLRVHDLEGVPPGLQGDEMFNAWDASRVGPGHFPIFLPANFGREPAFIYLMALSTRLVGMGLWSVRLPGVFCGVVVVFFTYLLADRLHGFRVGVLAAALMALSFWPVFISRVGLRAVALPACQAVAMYALDRGVRESSIPWTVGAGVSLGLLPYTYIPGQLFLVVPVAWLALVLLQDREWRKQRLRLSLLAGAVALLTLLPFALFALRHADTAYSRVQELDYELRQLGTGNFQPVWESTRAVLGMFTWAGDPTWRYNLAGRPVFDWGTGLFFYLGLAVAFWRMRRPGYVLWLIWLPVMLLPAMVTGAAPSFWRSVGALMPIYVLPAVGVDFAWDWAERNIQKPVGDAFPLLVGVGLVAIGADTWHDYFFEWPRSCEVSHIYESDLTAAARYLASYEDPAAPAWISSEHAYDLSRVAFDVQSDYPGPVRWFNGMLGSVWPSPTHERDVLILFTESCPANADAHRVLEPYLIYQEDAPCGRPHLWVYRLPRRVLSETPWSPSHLLEGSFANGFEVLGYDAPSEAERGSVVPFVLYWRVPQVHGYEYDDPPRTLVCLEDAEGHAWSETTHFVAYPMQDWTPGDLLAERFEISVPQDLPPQRMTFRVGQFNSSREIVFAHPTRGGIPLRVGSLQVSGQVTRRPRWDEGTPLYGDLALLGFSLTSQQVHAGGEIESVLEWQAVRQPAGDYAVRFELRARPAGSSSILAHREVLWEETHPTGMWAPGEVVRSFHEISLPRDTPSGDFDVYVSLIDPEDGQSLGEPLRVGIVTVTSRPHTFELPAPQFPLEALFGTSIRLLGYELDKTGVISGGQLEVTLYWQALGTMEEDYAVFVHLYEPEGGGILGQHDGPPLSGSAPTSTWVPGEVVADAHAVPVGDDIQGGIAPLGVGLYLPDTGRRLPVTVDGELQPDDSLILTEIEVQ
ncbi:MAG: glycosyltransferase family 39 protein [Anaerolineae bacterium]